MPNNQNSLVCDDCCNQITLLPCFMKGDPRNQAIIIHEDGWAPHSTSSLHSVAAITISRACLSKLSRSSGTSCQVYSFIPVDQLPKKAPHKYDVFFIPLIEENEESFLHGTKVFFKSSVAGHSLANDTFNLRLIPLLLTADMKAHAEIGLTSAGGKKGCRRCEVVGEYVQSKHHYYYGNFLKRYYHRTEEQTAERSLKRAMEIENAITKSSRAELCKEYGITGVSAFYRWYTLCRFDPVRDFVIDTMHVVLNLARNELELLLGRDDGIRKENLINRPKLADALRYVKWTPELKNGRIPAITATSDPHHLGHWKTEEFVKFLKVAPFVLHTITSKPHYKCFLLLHRICQFLFSMSMRVCGWQEDDIRLLTKLLWLYAIRFEEC